MPAIAYPTVFQRDLNPFQAGTPVAFHPSGNPCLDGGGTPPPAPPRRAAGRRAAQPAETSLTILIVEDERATAWALAQRFEEEGYQARTAATAEEALAVLRRGGVDLVIADLRLPGLSGVELIRRLARRKRPIPSIALTAHGTPRLVREVLGAGALQCFLKPFPVDQLVDGVQQALRGEAA